jgi:hypothetical protein
MFRTNYTEFQHSNTDESLQDPFLLTKAKDWIHTKKTISVYQGLELLIAAAVIRGLVI